MRTLLLLCSLALVIVTGVSAGPLFDDYLNPIRPGPSTPPGTSQAATGPDRAIGQVLAITAGTAEVYRIGVRPVYDTWAVEESVTLALYDSPRKARKLGSYTIGGATSQVDGYVLGTGSSFERINDRVLYFHLRSDVRGLTSVYCELTSSGGDGRVAFSSFETDAYAGGEAAGAGSTADLSFDCHIKPVADREANLSRFFNERLDLSHPSLAAVKNAADRHDWEEAIAQTVKHFHERMDLWDVWRDEMRVKINPQADTTLADLILKGSVRHADTGAVLPWRKESWWVPVVPDAKAPNHGIDPPPFLWHFDRQLAGAYSATGKAEYARAAIDLRMQWILDNPNPKQFYSTPEFPYYHELWNDRTAAARVPGHADLVYARLYYFPDWSNDEKLVLLSFFEDNARWLHNSESGGNWGVTAAKAALDFGLTFPEWKISEPCRNWGATEMIRLSNEGIRGDGTCSEGAVKYHAMIARRLLGLLEYQRQGLVELSEEDSRGLVRILNGMYDHMAHTLQPNGYVVMCGDSWHENYSEEPSFSDRQVVDAGALARRLRESNDHVSKLLRGRLSEDTAARLNAERATVSDELVRALVDDLNKIVRSGEVLPADAFAGVGLRERTRRALAAGVSGDEVTYLNKWLIEDAYPTEIAAGYRYSELYSAGTMLDRPDFVWIASRGEEGTPPAYPSKVYPEAGYFILRSDFGIPGEPYSNARQAFIHNGGWFGSHGHWDLNSINLYGYGRTLIVDPGQYEFKPDAGIDVYWSSRIHSMLVLDDRDQKREPGPSVWAANDVIDWFDGSHFGYRHLDADRVRRRVAFLKPDYYLVDDSASTPTAANWAQVWNLADPAAAIDKAAGTMKTTHPSGGNVVLLSSDLADCEVEQAPGITAVGGEKTTIFRLRRTSSSPHYRTLLYPYDGALQPEVKVERMQPDGGSTSGLHYALRIDGPRGADWTAFGNSNARSSYRGGKHAVRADFAAVRMDDAGAVRSFAWARGSGLVFSGALLARSDAPVHSLAVRYEGTKLFVDAREPDSSLAVAARGCTTFVVNGKPASGRVTNGLFRPFASLSVAIVCDDAGSFERLTQGSEWIRVCDPSSWSVGYTHHETDVGRKESGDYVFAVHRAGAYRVEVFLPTVTVTPSNRVEYSVPARVLRPARTGGAVLDVREDDGAAVVTLDQQAMSGWVSLGDYSLPAGELRVRATNVTSTDGIYLIADAVRLTPAQ